MISVLFVCLGNICRSPLAEGLFKMHVNEQGLKDFFTIDSAGTAAYHLGELADKRTREMAVRQDSLSLSHKARQFVANDFFSFDYIVAMDKTNYQNVIMLKPLQGTAKVLMMRHYDSKNITEEIIPDPYYGTTKDFEEVHKLLKDCTKNLLQAIVEEKSIAL
ncbi:MAG: low molecular weight protein-tyrosine-phosphatase [Bacteroidota bacterium]